MRRSGGVGCAEQRDAAEVGRGGGWWGRMGDARAAEDNNAAGEEERRRAAARRGRDAARSANVLGDFLGIGVSQAAANSTHATDMGDLGIGDAGSDLYAAGPEWTWAHRDTHAHTREVPGLENGTITWLTHVGTVTVGSPRAACRAVLALLQQLGGHRNAQSFLSLLERMQAPELIGQHSTAVSFRNNLPLAALRTPAQAGAPSAGGQTEAGPAAEI